MGLLDLFLSRVAELGEVLPVINLYAAYASFLWYCLLVRVRQLTEIHHLTICRGWSISLPLPNLGMIYALPKVLARVFFIWD